MSMFDPKTFTETTAYFRSSNYNNIQITLLSQMYSIKFSRCKNNKKILKRKHPNIAFAKPITKKFLVECSAAFIVDHNSFSSYIKGINFQMFISDLNIINQNDLY